VSTVILMLCKQLINEINERTNWRSAPPKIRRHAESPKCFCIENSRRVGHAYHPIHTKLVVALCYIYMYHVLRAPITLQTKPGAVHPQALSKFFLLLSNYYNINSLKQENAGNKSTPGIAMINMLQKHTESTRTFLGRGFIPFKQMWALSARHQYHGSIYMCIFQLLCLQICIFLESVCTKSPPSLAQLFACSSGSYYYFKNVMYLSLSSL
jgi:hypothetical protein